MFLQYLISGKFTAPDLWTGNGKPDIWLDKLLNSLPSLGNVPLNNTLQCAFAKLYLLKQARQRLVLTFSTSSFIALESWLVKTLPPVIPPSAHSLSPEAKLAETAFHYLLQANVLTVSPRGSEALNITVSGIPWFTEIHLPEEREEMERWRAIVENVHVISQDLRDKLIARFCAPVRVISDSVTTHGSRRLPVPSHKPELPLLVPESSGQASSIHSDNEGSPVRLSDKVSTLLPRDSSHPYDQTEVLMRVPDAGACLLWPLLPSLFAQLELTSKNQFHSVETRNKAVCFLDHLIWGDGQSAEWRTPFSRWLCGWKEEEQFEWYFPEKLHTDLIAQLLIQFTSMVDGWHRCGPDDIRAFFLQRPGNLTFDKRRWCLQPDEGAQDILLQALPWPVRELRLPWREDILFVQWL